MSKIHTISVLILVILSMFNVQSVNIREPSHENLFGTDPVSGFKVEYGCYKNKCWAYCNGLDRMWCWTNQKSGQGARPCSSDSNCDTYYYKCQGACGL